MTDWRELPEGYLALIVLLDQIPRNMFRASARAFATDDLAVDIVETALKRGFEQARPEARRRFVYMPLMHAEDVDHQRRCVDLFEALENDPGGVEYAIKHLEIIERFNRFPHRNEVLGHQSTPQEAAFLKTPGSSF